MKRSPLPRPTKRIRARNPKRQRQEFARAYGSEARVEWVKSQPCAVCRVGGYTENAHCPPKSHAGGTGRKADSRFIVPLCGDRIGTIGCHGMYDRLGRSVLVAAYNVDFDALAADTERRWQLETA